ncbi:MAG: monofunctional biosynthetic peptidoglycan transglycosylase [Gammaproteobacteria bacterium]|nr:monofunctional biosynthetic peptidoglycan transglycosylase [Gammaproteobacteria bacterium]
MTRRRKWSFRGRLQGWLAAVLAVVVLVTVLPILSLRWVAPPATAFMLAEWGSRGFASAPTYRWVPQAGIAPELALAVVAAEDQRFPEHWGFDLSAIQDALRANRNGGLIRGASTISQQLTKNLFLWRGRSWLRKGLEAWLTPWLELLLPKQRILELYLNLAQFGPGLYGAEAAARYYFGTGAGELTIFQAALLATALPNPEHSRPDRPSSGLRSKQRWIMQQMDQLGTTYLAEIGW